VSTPNPQAGPALALAQLLTEHPELPRLNWSITKDGHLSGSSFRDDEDVRPVIAAHQHVMGGRVGELRYVPKDTGAEAYTSYLMATWRDVRFHLSVGCPVSALVEPEAVAV
jgi:hypothetical protein